mmetsp:Transcript_16535/g.35936  ORF Transcript_16535/g.35936 Transcript_16535/m.35936 type:complete len:279 (-) Transcript_16535:99-935(-)
MYIRVRKDLAQHGVVDRLVNPVHKLRHPHRRRPPRVVGRPRDVHHDAYHPLVIPHVQAGPLVDVLLESPRHRVQQFGVHPEEQHRGRPVLPQEDGQAADHRLAAPVDQREVAAVAHAVAQLARNPLELGRGRVPDPSEDSAVDPSHERRHQAGHAAPLDVGAGVTQQGKGALVAPPDSEVLVANYRAEEGGDAAAAPADVVVVSAQADGPRATRGDPTGGGGGNGLPRRRDESFSLRKFGFGGQGEQGVAAFRPVVRARRRRHTREDFHFALLHHEMA